MPSGLHARELSPASTPLDWSDFSYRYPDLSERSEVLSLPQVDLTKTVIVEGENLSMRLDNLCPPRSVSLRIFPDFWCDCHDLSLAPLGYRLHMYTGQSAEGLSFDEKLLRMTRWQEALLRFDEVMTYPSTGDLNTISSHLKQFELPRGQYAIIPTGNWGLKKLFDKLGAITHQGEIFFPWDKLIELCRSGQFVATWRSLKAR